MASEVMDGNCNCYFENMYWKVRCLIALKKMPKAKVLIAQATIQAQDAGYNHYVLGFESLLHMINISDNESIEFIEQTTIPYLIDVHEYYKALDYCDLLENVYKKRGKGYKIRILEMSSVVRRILENIAMGDVSREEVLGDESIYNNIDYI